MAARGELPTPRFQPLHPAPRSRLIVAFVAGPLAWLVAVCITAVVLHRTQAIEIGLLIAFASFLVGVLVLSLLRAARRRQESRYADHG
jgi:hypothetical protein